MRINKKAFTLVELLLVVTVIGVLSTVAYLGVGSFRTFMSNAKVDNDLLAITNAMNRYAEDVGMGADLNSFPVPETGGSMNVLCFNADLSYAHDCSNAAFRQAMIDSSLLTKRYLRKVPIDPRTGSRYVYGVTNDGRYWQVAGIIKNDDGEWTAKTRGNTYEGNDFEGDKGYYLPSLIRAFDKNRFVTEDSPNLPYSPKSHKQISAALRNILGAVTVNGGDKLISDPLAPGDSITTGADGSADIFFSDGSVSHLDSNSELEILKDGTEVEENNDDSIITKIKLKLFSGKVWNKVVRLAEKSEFSIETTSAIAGVRGTEFGVWEQENKVIVKSGAVWVGENLPSNLISSVDGIPQQATMTDTGPTAETAVTDPDLLDYIEEHHRSNILSGAVIPFMVLVKANPVTAHLLYISFNGEATEDVYDIDGVEIFAWDSSGMHLNDFQNPDAMGSSPYYTEDFVTYDDDKKAYVFPIHFTMPDVDFVAGMPKMFVVRAFTDQPGGGRTYSAFSWNPWGFLGKPDKVVYTDLADDLDFPPVIRTLVSIEVTGPDSISNGAQQHYLSEGTYDNGSTSSITLSSTWSVTPAGYGTLNQNVFTPTSTGAVTLTSEKDGFSDSKDVTITPALPSLETLCVVAGGWHDDTNDECWVFANASTATAPGQSCTDACATVDTGNVLTPPVTCNTDPGWNDCGDDGVCGTTAPEGNDGAVCMAFDSMAILAGTFGPQDFAPFWLDDGSVKSCTPRDTSGASCDAETLAMSFGTFRRLCSCTQ